MFRGQDQKSSDDDSPEESSFHQIRFGWLKTFFSDLRGTQRLATRNHLPLLTAAVAFLSLFALCPLFILSFMGSQSILGHLNTPESLADLKVLIDALLPNASPLISENLINLTRQSTFTSLVGVVILIYSTYELFEGLHIVFMKISVRGTERNFLWSSLISVVSFLVVFSASCTFILLTTTREPAMQALVSHYFPETHFPALRPVASAASLLVVIGSITFIYKLMPTQKIKTIHAFYGSLLFVGLFLCGRIFYEIYVAYYQIFNQSIYGSFVSGLVVLVWLYYLSRIFLFCAQYAIYLEDRDSDD